MKVKLLADYWQQRKKDGDGNTYYVQRRLGDEFDVTEAEARHLLRTEGLLRPMAEEVKVESEQKSSTTTATVKR